MATWFQAYPVGVYLMLGRRGCGKTTLQRKLVGEMLADGRELALIHDRRGQYPGKIWQSIEAFRRADDVPPVNVFVRDKPTAVVALAAELAEKGTRVLLVVDELDQLCRSSRWFDDPPAQRGKEPEHGNTYNVCHYGRHIGRPPDDNRIHYGVTLVGSARRPTNLHTDFQELGERYYLFTMNGRRSREWVEQTTDSDEMADRVARQPKYQFVVYDPADTSDIEVKSPTRKRV